MTKLPRNHPMIVELEKAIELSKKQRVIDKALMDVYWKSWENCWQKHLAEWDKTEKLIKELENKHVKL